MKHAIKTVVLVLASCAALFPVAFWMGKRTAQKTGKDAAVIRARIVTNTEIRYEYLRGNETASATERNHLLRLYTDYASCIPFDARIDATSVSFSLANSEITNRYQIDYALQERAWTLAPLLAYSFSSSFGMGCFAGYKKIGAGAILFPFKRDAALFVSYSFSL